MEYADAQDVLEMGPVSHFDLSYYSSSPPHRGAGSLSIGRSLHVPVFEKGRRQERLSGGVRPREAFHSAANAMLA